MELSAVLDHVGYSASPNYAVGDELVLGPQNRHVFRKAVQECGLHGAYLLRDPRDERNIPVVYVCKAADESEARKIHKRVWNQGIVPFLIVVSPRTIRLYSGFRYVESRNTAQPGLIEELTDLHHIESALSALSPGSIDSGQVWKQWGQHVRPEQRVDRKLLDNLLKLDLWMRESGIAPEFSHSVIGRCVYLKYLRARGILSDRRLEEWGLDWEGSFSRFANAKNFTRLNTKLNEWLNGSVFPISDSWVEELGDAKLQIVSGIFSGDTDNQLHLNFEPYDFSFIPVETLSVIYEQFLHTPGKERGSESKGVAASAYYTPAPLVSYVVEQMERELPLRRGMRVIDPSCGSGAFLVDCYRRLIEQELSASDRRLRPTELRDLLTEHIFGIDADQDACRVAEFSLLLTLLDYIQPPDLRATPNFRLPNLSNRNIVHGDTFDDKLFSDGTAPSLGSYDWVIGNPPWKELNPKELTTFDVAVHQWMLKHQRESPTGGNQVAEAFAWRALELLSANGLAGLVVPASSLFKYEARRFRERFFSTASLIAVANFSNLAEVLFAGRSRVPAATMLFSKANGKPGSVEVFSPLLANQVSQAPSRSRERRDIWSVTINTSEIRDVPYKDISEGSSMAWKLAAWGSHLDTRLLESVRRMNRKLGDLEDEGVLKIAEGLQVRKADAPEELEHHPELEGLYILELAPLAKLKRAFIFPSGSLRKLSAEETYVRRGRFKVPYAICEPPHLIVGAARTFAVYSNEKLIVPPRQIGIFSEKSHLLKALALLINSDFAMYQQALTSPEYLTKRPRATLRALREMPIPFSGNTDLSAWSSLHDKLVAALGESRASLLRQADDLVNSAFGLDWTRASVVDDFVNVRMGLLDGRMGEAAVRRPTTPELESYAKALRSTLDDFVAEDGTRHSVQVFEGEGFALAQVRYPSAAQTKRVVTPFAKAQSDQVSQIRGLIAEQPSQWLYFNRNLRLYDGDDTYILKPLQRFHWMRSQAALDAGDIIAERMEPAEA
jgi:hypothetical protein